MIKIENSRYILFLLALGVGVAQLLLTSEQILAAGTSSQYILMAEDVLHISVWKEKGLEHEVLVQPDGKLSFPLAGHVQAAGKTAEQVEVEITKRLKKYIPDALVTVSLIKPAGNKIYVIGKVARPGEYVIGSNIDVLQALSLAGGLTPFADADDIKIVRKVGNKTKLFLFDYGEIAEDGDELQLNIKLQSGDVVVVP